MPQNSDLSGLVRHLLQTQGGRRRLLALAGPPGVGKSYFAKALLRALTKAGMAEVAVVPMDGFHLDDAVLKARGWRARKGAPHTFDLGGLSNLLGRLRANGASEIFVPLFDRERELARAAAGAVAQSAQLVIVEGNYLLLDAPGWRDLAPLFDVRVMLKAERSVVEDRLMQRWRDLGYAPKAIQHKLEENDIPNLELVTGYSLEPDFCIWNQPLAPNEELLTS